MGRSRHDTIEQLPRRRPGDELRAAQQVLETEMRDLVVAFSDRTGALVSNIHVEYLQLPSGDGHGSADIIVRTSLET